MVIRLAILLCCAQCFGQNFQHRRPHPISSRLLVTSMTTANAAEYTTAAFIAGSFRLVLALAVTSDTVLPDLHALTSLHGTWTVMAVTNYDVVATPLHRLSVWRLMVTNGTVSSTLTNKFANAATGGGMVVMQFNGINTKGAGGAAAVTNIVMNALNASANPSITLAAIEKDNNSVWYGFGNDINVFAGTVPQDWYEDADLGYNTPPTGLYAAHRNNTTNAVITVTRAAADWGGFGVEIKVQ